MKHIKGLFYMLGYGASDRTIQKNIPSLGLRRIKVMRKDMIRERISYKQRTFAMRYGSGLKRLQEVIA